MASPFVPLAHPHNVLGCCWDFTNWTLLRLALLSEVDGSLDAGLEIGPVFLGQFVNELSEHMPVQACNQMLMVLSLG